MKTKKILVLFIIAVSTSISIIGCKKKNNSVTDVDTSAASDNSTADAAFNDVQNISDQAAKGALVFYSTLYNGTDSHIDATSAKSSCAAITHDSISTPHILTIDFGATNCLCTDGRYRRGIINVSYTGHYRDSASVHTTTFTNYFIDNNQLLGTKTVTNNGHNSSGHLTFTIVVDGQVIKASGGGTHTWQANRVREWMAGESTSAWLDDVYTITGYSTGTSVSGATYTSIITTPLHRALNCRWFDSGVVEVTPAGKPVRIINYGGGTCDNQATVTIGGTVYPITLH